MPEVASDIVVSGAKLYYANIGLAAPADTLNTTAAWPAGWTYLGYTLEALTLNYSFDPLDIEVQQTMATVARTRMKEELTLETVLAEFTGTTLSLAMAGTNTVVPPGVATTGKETVTIGGDYNLPVKQWGIQGSYRDETGVERSIRVFVWRATVAEGGELAWDRTKPAGIPLQIRALADTTKPIGSHLVQIVRITAPSA